MLFIVGEVVADKKVEMPIVIVVEEGRAGAPEAVVHSSSLGHICESAFAAVAVELAGAVAGDVKVGPAIVVIISDRQSHTQHAIRNAGALGHVGEGAIAVIAV